MVACAKGIDVRRGCGECRHGQNGGECGKHHAYGDKSGDQSDTSSFHVILLPREEF